MPQNIRTESPRLSIIIPARNEALRLPSSLEKIANYLAEVDYAAEVIVVDNASTDGTGNVACEFARQHEWLQINVVGERCLGKGAAVRTGMLRASGDNLFLCDADLSMSIEQLEKLLTPLFDGTDIAIGCREGTGATRTGEPLHRRLMGRLFNGLIKSLGLTEFTDTQCGFKAFRRNVAHDLFAVQKICGWGFDVEVLSIARLRGYSVASIPVEWNYDADSRVRPFRDALTMLYEIAGIRGRLWLGLYDPVNWGQTSFLSPSKTKNRKGLTLRKTVKPFRRSNKTGTGSEQILENLCGLKHREAPFPGFLEFLRTHVLNARKQ
jgi:dolichyl-phosphate beta-glucosyltransferase